MLFHSSSLTHIFSEGLTESLTRSIVVSPPLVPRGETHDHHGCPRRGRSPRLHHEESDHHGRTHSPLSHLMVALDYEGDEGLNPRYL